MIMGIKEMQDYLKEELKAEKIKMLMNEENKYSYLFMLMNDMGFDTGMEE